MIFILQQILPKYRYEVLKYLDVSNFRVAYSNVVKEGSLRSYKTDEDLFIEVPIIRIGEKYIQSVLPYIKSLKPAVIVYTPELRNFTFWFLLLMKPFFKFRLVAWTHGINNKDFFSGKLGFQTKLRMLMMRFSDDIIVYSKDRAEVLQKILNKKVLVAKNTLDTHILNEVYKSLDSEGIEEIRSELKVKSKFNLIYVGRLIKEKEIEYALDLFRSVAQDIDDINFYIIGDGPDRARLESIVEKNNINGVYFLGQIDDPYLLGKWLYISDLHLHPGYVGLAVVHSLCFETPIVTRIPSSEYGPFHSPEYVYLTAENSIRGGEGLQHEICKVLKDKQHLFGLKKQARKTYEQECDISGFISIFESLVQ